MLALVADQRRRLPAFRECLMRARHRGLATPGGFLQLLAHGLDLFCGGLELARDALGRELADLAIGRQPNRRWRVIDRANRGAGLDDVGDPFLKIGHLENSRCCTVVHLMLPWLVRSFQSYSGWYAPA